MQGSQRLQKAFIHDTALIPDFKFKLCLIGINVPGKFQDKKTEIYP
jgi:hypothetical protein